MNNQNKNIQKKKERKKKSLLGKTWGSRNVLVLDPLKSTK